MRALNSPPLVFLRVSLTMWAAFVFQMGYAHAQAVVSVPAPPAATIVLAPWWQLVLSIIQAAAVPALALLVAFLNAHVKSASLRSALLDAAQNEAKGIYQTLVQTSGNLSQVTVNSPLIATAVNNLSAHVPDAIGYFKKNDHALQQMVLNAFGGLLASDPTVSVLPSVAVVEGDITKPLPPQRGVLGLLGGPPPSLHLSSLRQD